MRLRRIFDDVANELVLSSEQFPAYTKIKDQIHVRIRDLPIVDNLPDLRQTHLNRLVRVNGVVTRRTGVFPQLKFVKFKCMLCDTLLGPFRQSNAVEIKPGTCPTCQEDGPFKLDQEETIYRNYQKIVIQEAPGSVPAGRVPRHKDVVLLADLIDKVRPGDEVDITGVYVHSLNTGLAGRAGFPVFSTLIEANYVAKLHTGKTRSGPIGEDDKRKICRLARDPRIFEKIVSSLAPSIFGEKDVKRALVMAIFGGCSKNIDGKHRVRGDVNVLLLGDPGCAKSQLLKYCCSVVPRAVYTTGKGASAVGLTAGVHKDILTKEWTLEGGALVLADNGLCCIDEFDKMNEQDRASIHEAMEQQSISVSKAGIVTSLQARCSVVAAANPLGGQYDSSATFVDNIELTDPILQRFDILCVLQDVVDPLVDERLATFVVASHCRAVARIEGCRRSHELLSLSLHPEVKKKAMYLPFKDDCYETIPQDLLEKYVAYARDNCRPRLHSIDQSKIARLYADLRREAVVCGGVPVAVRHLESLIRLAEAHTKISLRDHVRDDDVDCAIAIFLNSFINAQKHSVRTSLQRSFRKYLTTSSDYFELLLNALHRLAREAQTYATLRSRPDQTLEVLIEDFEAKAREFNVHDLNDFYKSSGFLKNFEQRGTRIVARPRMSTFT